MSARGALFWLALVALLSCEERATRAHLIQIDAVRQIWEQPSQLSLHGTGFPAGMRGEAWLVGTLFPPGELPLTRTLRVPCHALSATLAAVNLNAPEVADLPEGPFAGSVELRFDAQPGARLTGAIERALFRLSAGQRALPAQFAIEQRAQRFQRALGIDALERSERGLVIGELSAAGPGRRAGLAIGDEIVRMDGAPVQLPVDVLGRGEPARVELSVRSAREAELRSVRIDLAAPGPRSDWPLWLLCCALAASSTALLARAFGVPHWPQPTRRELWLASLSALSLLAVGMFVLESTAPSVRDVLRACAAGVLLGGVAVYLMRRARRTLRTTRDPALSPFL